VWRNAHGTSSARTFGAVSSSANVPIYGIVLPRRAVVAQRSRTRPTVAQQREKRPRNSVRRSKPGISHSGFTISSSIWKPPTRKPSPSLCSRWQETCGRRQSRCFPSPIQQDRRRAGVPARTYSSAAGPAGGDRQRSRELTSRFVPEAALIGPRPFLKSKSQPSPRFRLTRLCVQERMSFRCSPTA
jgi:hypothetical protein